MVKSFLGYLARLILFYPLPQFFEDSSFGLSPQQPVFGKNDITQEVYSVTKLPDTNLVRMKLESKFSFQKILNFGNKRRKIFLIAVNDNKIIGVAGIVANLKFMFYELIKFV